MKHLFATIVFLLAIPALGQQFSKSTTATTTHPLAKKSVASPLRLTHPNGGEVFVVGTDSVITWEGIASTDTVTLLFSIDKGQSWRLITEQATGLRFTWKLPTLYTSEQCLIRVLQKKVGAGDSIVQMNMLGGHQFEIERTYWSPNNKYFATGDYQYLYLWDAVSGRLIYYKFLNHIYLAGIQWSPDSKQIAGTVSGFPGDKLLIWDAVSGVITDTLKTSGSILDLDWSPDGKKIVTTNAYNATIWDVKTKTEEFTLPHPDYVNIVRWSPDGSKISSGTQDNQVIVWDALNGKKIRTLTQALGGAVWSPDGKFLSTGGINGLDSATVWDANTGTKIRTFKNGYINWNPKGNTYATLAEDGSTDIWDVLTGNKINSINRRMGYWSPDGTRMLSKGPNNTLIIWDATFGTILATISDNNKPIGWYKWSSDGTRIASGSDSRTAIIWDSMGVKLHTFVGYIYGVEKASWNLEGTRLATYSTSSSTAYIWNPISGKNELQLEGHSDIIQHLCWSPDGKKLATASKDQTAIIWDASKGTKIALFSGHSKDIFRVSWSPDGKRLATSSFDKTTIIWDTTGKKLITLTGHRGIIEDGSWSPDGKKYATASDDSTVIIWDMTTGDKLFTFTDHTWMVKEVSWSPYGSRLATSSLDGTTIIWDTYSGKKLHTLVRNKIVSVFNHAFWSPDGSLLATSGRGDTNVVIWDATTGKMKLTLPGGNYQVSSICWSPDGTSIAKTHIADYNIVSFWDAKTGANIKNIPTYRAQNISWSMDGNWLAVAQQSKVIIWQMNDQEVLQEDTSDSVFSIIKSPITAYDINFGPIPVGSTKDSLFSSRIANLGTKEFRLDSVKIVGTQSPDEFTVLSTMKPNVFQPGERASIKYRCTPAALGIRRATLVIYTQAEVIERTIRCDGVAPLQNAPITVTPDSIDFGDVRLGSGKDSINGITVTNHDTTDRLLTAITLTDSNAKMFFVLSPKQSQLPLKLSAGATLHMPTMAFVATAVGRKHATLHLSFDGGIEKQVYLTGTCIFHDTLIADVEPDTLDFGRVVFGASGDTVVRSISILNKGTLPFTVGATHLSSQRASEFAFVPPMPDSFMLVPGAAMYFVVRFVPQAIGRTSGIVRFDVVGRSSPLEVVLLGEGISNTDSVGAVLIAPALSANAGEELSIPITLKNLSKVLESGTSKIRMNLQFNSTLLEPIGDTPLGTLFGGNRSIPLDISLKPDPQEIIARLPFRAALGNDSTTLLQIVSPKVDSGRVNLSTMFGSFQLLGICYAGGMRLLNPGGSVSLALINQNPIKDKMEIELETTESGKTTLILYDLRGRDVRRFLVGEVATGRRVTSLDMQDIPQGLYVLLLQTPTETRSIQVVVTR